MANETDVMFIDEMPTIKLDESVRRMTLGLRTQLMGYTDQEIDDFMVEFASVKMKDKMEQSRNKGRGGWHTPKCSTETLRKMLQEHIEKGDMIDVMNIAGMILVREYIGYID